MMLFVDIVLRPVRGLQRFSLLINELFSIISSRPLVVLLYMNNYLWQILFVLHCVLILHWVHDPSLQLLKYPLLKTTQVHHDGVGAI